MEQASQRLKRNLKLVTVEKATTADLNSKYPMGISSIRPPDKTSNRMEDKTRAYSFLGMTFLFVLSLFNFISSSVSLSSDISSESGEDNSIDEVVSLNQDPA